MNLSSLARIAALLGAGKNLGFPAGFGGTATPPRVKPWLSELDLKVRRGPTSPSAMTRQRRRAEERADIWTDFRTKRSKKGILWNDAQVAGNRTTRRACSRTELNAVRNPARN